MASIKDRFMGFFLRHASFFEPLGSYGISYYLKQTLKPYQKRGLISFYKVQVKRLGKWHYKIAVDVDVTESQVALLIGELLTGAGR